MSKDNVASCFPFFPFRSMSLTRGKGAVVTLVERGERVRLSARLVEERLRVLARRELSLDKKPLLEEARQSFTYHCSYCGR